MPPRPDAVALDLNNPVFQQALFALPKEEQFGFPGDGFPARAGDGKGGPADREPAKVTSGAAGAGSSGRQMDFRDKQSPDCHGKGLVCNDQSGCGASGSIPMSRKLAGPRPPAAVCRGKSTAEAALSTSCRDKSTSFDSETAPGPEKSTLCNKQKSSLDKELTLLYRESACLDRESTLPLREESICYALAKGCDGQETFCDKFSAYRYKRRRICYSELFSATCDRKTTSATTELSIGYKESTGRYSFSASEGLR